MKKNMYVLVLLMVTLSGWAIPAQRGQWVTLTLSDGSVVRAEARGDERLHYWQSADGVCYVVNDTTGEVQQADLSSLQRTLASKPRRVIRTPRSLSPVTRAGTTGASLFQGTKKGLIILAQFQDRKFSSSDPLSLYRDIANVQGYSQNGFKSSISDYFLAQSGGQFELTFDVAGPVTLPNNYAYYGNNEDAKVGEMVHDVCLAVDDSIDFSRYDWDGDGVAEEVFVLYAGYGQADHSMNDSYIWPHMYSLQSYDYYYDHPLVLDKTTVDVYACANELTVYDRLAGIGTFCHEFSHCLGFPDMYDINDTGNYGMYSWDLMDYGCYNDDGFTPAGYTGYEKMLCGWTTPLVLSTDTVINNLSPLSDMGQSAVIYNPANSNEYYILDNRQQKGYDAYLPGHGLLITHIDYDEAIWYYNMVNTTGTVDGVNISNTHQRATIFHADNTDDVSSAGTDAYPYQGNDSLTNTSLPAATLYNKNTDGTYVMGRGLWNIAENADGTMSFRFGTDTTKVVSPALGDSTSEGILLHETFDHCSGTGGNDGLFGGMVASAPFVPDLTGWQSDNAYGAYQCARFGNSNYVGQGYVSSPSFILPGDTVTLSFRAACWNTKGDGTSLHLALNGTDAKFVDSGTVDMILTMTKGAWTTYTLKIVGTGTATVSFDPNKRFFLDDVLIQTVPTTGIRNVTTTPDEVASVRGIYSLGGQYLGTDARSLPRGLYIVDGKKMVVGSK